MKKLMILSAALLLVAVCVRAVSDDELAGSCDKKCPDGSSAMLISGGKCVCKNASEGQNTMTSGPVQRTAKPS